MSNLKIVDDGPNRRVGDFVGARASETVERIEAARYFDQLWRRLHEGYSVSELADRLGYNDRDTLVKQVGACALAYIHLQELRVLGNEYAATPLGEVVAFHYKNPNGQLGWIPHQQHRERMNKIGTVADRPTGPDAAPGLPAPEKCKLSDTRGSTGVIWKTAWDAGRTDNPRVHVREVAKAIVRSGVHGTLHPRFVADVMAGDPNPASQPRGWSWSIGNISALIDAGWVTRFGDYIEITRKGLALGYDLPRSDSMDAFIFAARPMRDRYEGASERKA